LRISNAPGRLMKVLLCSTVLCLAPVLAQSADLPVRTTAPPPVFIAAPTWKGAYFGGHLGHGWGSFDSSSLRSRENGVVLGGVHVGYNDQSGMWVFGLEGDLSATPWKEIATNNGLTAEFRTRWMGSLRGRAGIAIDQFLIYGTGGVGAVDRDLRFTASRNVLANIDYYKVGAVVGGGVEFKLTQKLVLGVEGLHYFVKNAKGKGGLNIRDSSAPSLTGSRAGNVGVVRTRLSFRW
jgi:outer membrane immunogenic protein